MKNPCVKDCPKRNASCHCNCPEYAEFEKFNARRRELIHMSNIQNDCSPGKEAQIRRSLILQMQKGRRHKN